MEDLRMYKIKMDPCGMGEFGPHSFGSEQILGVSSCEQDN
jgi:hypothetical protein